MLLTVSVPIARAYEQTSDLCLVVLSVLLRNAYVAPTTSSIASRVILALQLSLPALPASQLSPDLSLQPRLLSKIQSIALDNAAGTTSVLGKSLPLLLNASKLSSDEHRDIDLLIHPRVPPLVRALPHVEALALFRAEEGDEEADIRRRLGVAVVEEPMLPPATTQTVKIATPVLVAPKPSAPIATPLLVAQANESSILPPSNGSALFGKAPAPPAPSTLAQTPLMLDPVTQAPVAQAPEALITSFDVPEPVVAPSVPQAGPAPFAPPSSVPETFGYAPMQEDDDEDEPMPTINVDSDSDEDDE